MLESARTLFRAQGYDATSTREISSSAGVSESMLFRHFGSKSAIYEEAVLKPFIEFIQSFVDDWATRPPSEVVPELLADTYVSGLFQLCHDNLDLFYALSETTSEPDRRSAARQASALIQDHLDRLARQVGQYHLDVGLEPAIDPQLAVRFTVAIVVGAAYLGPDFFGTSNDGLAADIAAFVVRGAGYPSGD